MHSIKIFFVIYVIVLYNAFVADNKKNAQVKTTLALEEVMTILKAWTQNGTKMTTTS